MYRPPLVVSVLTLSIALSFFTGCDAETYENATTASADWADMADSRKAPRSTGKKPTATAPTAPTVPPATLYVDPSSHASRQADAWRASDADAASTMDNLADRALSVWIGDWTGDVTGTVDDALTDGGSQVRSIVVYNIPHRDCGFWSAGGASDAADYEAFIAEIAAGIGGRSPIVILEPDALALRSCLSASLQTERESLMADAVTTLTAAGAKVYIDAGDSNWISSSTMASGLTSANVAGAAGFALNVSHTELKGNEIDYAKEIQAIIGTSAHYVIDTGRADLGPTEDNQWCNPLGRAPGDLPTLNTGTRGLDAYLWVKPPGESDGECNGGPSAGAWWPEYALELAELGGL